MNKQRGPHTHTHSPHLNLKLKLIPHILLPFPPLLPHLRDLLGVPDNLKLRVVSFPRASGVEVPENVDVSLVGG